MDDANRRGSLDFEPILQQTEVFRQGVEGRHLVPEPQFMHPHRRRVLAARCDDVHQDPGCARTATGVTAAAAVRHHLADGHRIGAMPILGGLDYEYRLVDAA